MRSASNLMTFVFVVCLGLQWNDPDPLSWALPYGICASLSAAWAARVQLPMWLLVSTGSVFLILLAAYLPFLVAVRPVELLTWGPGRLSVEQAFESLGILLCTSWTWLLVWQARRACVSKSDAPETQLA